MLAQTINHQVSHMIRAITMAGVEYRLAAMGAVTLRYRLTVVVSALALSFSGASCAAPQPEANSVTAHRSSAFAQLTVIPSAASLAVRETLRVRAIALDEDLDTIANPSVTWRSSNPDIATVSELGIVTAQSPGLAGIAAESDGDVAVARITVLPASAGGAPVSERVQRADTAPAQRPATPVAQRSAERTPNRPQPLQNPRTAPLFDSVRSEPPPVTERSHEPKGFTPINTRHFRSKAKNDRDRGPNGSEGWSGTESRYRRFSIEHDPSAPTGDSSVAQMLYPANHRAGTGPATSTIYFPAGLKELYLSIWAKISPNWVGNQSNTNKMFFLGVAKGNNQFFFSAEGSGRSRLEAQLRLQGVLDERGRIRPNRAAAEVRRGEWQHWEFVFRCNTALNARDGSIDLWINGQHVTSVQGVNWTRSRRPTEPCEMSMLNWNPTYGGGGASPGVEQWLRFDRVYISGR